jgi:hypothetical protein
MNLPFTVMAGLVPATHKLGVDRAVWVGATRAAMKLHEQSETARAGVSHA